MGAWWIQVAEGNPRGTPELVKPDLGLDLAELDLATGKLISAPSAATQRFVGSNSKRDWSPDGRQLAFVVTEDTESRSKVIKVMPAAGGEARDLLRGVQIPAGEAPIAWAPDGLSLLFARRPSPPDSKTELWLISVQGGEPRKLELAADGMSDVCIHPDGRHIAFTAVQNRDEFWVLENFLSAPQAAKQ